MFHSIYSTKLVTCTKKIALRFYNHYKNNKKVLPMYIYSVEEKKKEEAAACLLQVVSIMNSLAPTVPFAVLHPGVYSASHMFLGLRKIFTRRERNLN